MSGESAISGSERPYTVGSFQNKLNQFQDLMKDITLQDVEATPEEKRQMITGEWSQLITGLFTTTSHVLMARKCHTQQAHHLGPLSARQRNAILMVFR